MKKNPKTPTGKKTLTQADREYLEQVAEAYELLERIRPDGESSLSKAIDAVVDEMARFVGDDTVGENVYLRVCERTGHEYDL